MAKQRFLVRVAERYGNLKGVIEGFCSDPKTTDLGLDLLDKLTEFQHDLNGSRQLYRSTLLHSTPDPQVPDVEVHMLRHYRRNSRYMGVLVNRHTGTCHAFFYANCTTPSDYSAAKQDLLRDAATCARRCK